MPTVSGTVTDRSGNVAAWSATWTVADTAAPMLMGCSASTNDHGGTEVWDGWRCYTQSSLYTYANRTGSQRPKFIAYSKDGLNLGGATPTYAGVFAEVKADLDAFYYTGGATSQTHSGRWGIKLYWSNGNENFDKGALATPHTAAGISAFVTSQRALYDACHYIDPTTGQRRFPDAYAGSDPTTDAERQGLVEDWLTPSAPYHDFVMWSMYPPGRSNTASDPTFNWPSFNDADWGANSNPQGFLVRCFRRTALAGIPVIAVGEVGIGDDPGDSTTRPYYVVHGLAHAFLRLATQYGLTVAWACWYDKQVDATSPQNVLSDEPTTTNPSTRQAWQNHLSYNHFRGGTHPAAWAGNPKAAWKTTGTFPTS